MTWWINQWIQLLIGRRSYAKPTKSTWLINKNTEPRFGRPLWLSLRPSTRTAGPSSSHSEPLPVPDESHVGNLHNFVWPAKAVDGLVGGDLASNGCADGDLFHGLSEEHNPSTIPWRYLSFVIHPVWSVRDVWFLLPRCCPLLSLMIKCHKNCS